jgi:hypothetical protein
MALINTDCASCGKQCINVEFCSEGASFDTSEDNGISLPRRMGVKIIANPDFWGFSGVLTSGWASFENGHYDFFDNHDETHSATKTCGGTTYGPFLNEQRPDVMYRSVYDPDDGSIVHYGSDGVLDSDLSEMGGATAYLIDRPKGLVAAVTSDGSSCDTTEPTDVFKKFPENYGWGNKINFSTKIYKNTTGAWRFSDIDSCYDTTYTPSGYLSECDGTSKRNTRSLEEYDAARIQNSGESGCLPDGSVAGKYSGSFLDSGIVRDTGVSPFLQAYVHYNNGPANKIYRGSSIGVKSPDYNGIYTVFDTEHYSDHSVIKFAGTASSINESGEIGDSGTWVAFGTYDPLTCCGESAYGVIEDTKRLSENINYHVDFRKIINIPKNNKQSNRLPADRETYSYEAENGVSENSYRYDHSYISVSGGSGLLENGIPVFEKALPYYGPFYEVDKYDTQIRHNHTISGPLAKNATCYTKKAQVEVYPDCITQYSRYNECETLTERFNTNRVPRLAIVYRGCDYNDPCNFDESGRPLGGWSDQNYIPTGINDLKRGLAGQEINMFINLGAAWGGVYQTRPCDCSASPPPGNIPPDHISIASPVTFPCFPDYDLNPAKYGCYEARYQLQSYITYGFSGNAGSLPDSEQCDSLHTYPEICSEKQPYTTYGYISNLCGKETQNRKNVIANAFARLHQSGSYLNTTPEVNIEEPMYWAFTDPGPAPYGGSNEVWSSGLSDDDSISNSGGQDYGYWGLTDQNGALTAPYYRTKEGYLSGCSASTEPSFIDFDTSGNFVDGFPTDAVPFLIEIETGDSCVGCSTSNMESGELTLTLNSLDASYIYGFGDPDATFGDAYGFNHCKYKGLSINPSYSCASGYGDQICGASDPERFAELAAPYLGETCECLDGTTISLQPVIAPSSEIALGWRSQNDRGGTIVRIDGCSDDTSSYLDDDYLPYSAGGYKLYGSFLLACPGNETTLTTPTYPNAKYEASAINNLWECGGCSIHKPSIFNGQGDINLVANFWLVSSSYHTIFDTLTDQEINNIDLSSSIVYSGINNNIGLCPGDKVYTYGCALASGFYGCGSGSAPHEECVDATLCNTCPTGVGSGLLECSECDEPIGYNGVPGARSPTYFNFNDCFCECSEPALIAEYTIDSNFDSILTSGDPAVVSCASVYWFGTEDIEPTLIGEGPPSPNLGLSLGSFYTKDWFDYSHSVNKIAENVSYQLYTPSTEGCSSIDIETCDTSNCLDSRSRSAQCGDPIYSSGGIPPQIPINRKSCSPEIMIVNKIECVTSGDSKYYNLVVSREYHEHDRTWSSQAGESCITRYGAYRYDDGESSGCQLLPYATPTDSVTPAYEAPCSINPPSGTSTQDFTYNTQPFTSGDILWNYYNLFYSSGFPTSNNSEYAFSANPSDCGADGSDEARDSIFDSGNFIEASGFGTLAVNRKHSCLQDITECGGDLFCNKLFFPRRSYLEGTKIAPFGASRICLQNGEIKIRQSNGYSDIANERISTEKKLRYIDFCDNSILEEALVDIDIDAVRVSVSDYLPLIGISHPGWKYQVDTKSCVIVNSGCSDYSLPSHSDQTILAGAFQPKTFNADNFDSMGYYLDKINAVGSDDCLFNPFKILVDVECSTNNIARRGIVNDSPTLLTGTMEIPSSTCKGFVGTPPCSCEDGKCGDNYAPFRSECQKIVLVEYTYEKKEVTKVCPCVGDPCEELCDDVTSKYALDAIGPTGIYYYGTDFFSEIESDIIGIWGECSGTPSGSGGPPVGGYEYACSGSDLSSMVKLCDGTYASTGQHVYINQWSCDEYVYIKGEEYASTCCELMDEVLVGQGVCSAELRTQLPVTCGSASVYDWDAVPSENFDPSGWWATDCHCNLESITDSPCNANSIIKVTITE